MANNDWSTETATDLQWPGAISNVEQKQQIAEKLADRLADGDTVGVGSGSTSFLTLMALSRKAKNEQIKFSVICTSLEIERAAEALALRVDSLNSGKPNWCFDGTDEIDPKGRLIKGRGGAMLREKLVMAASAKRFILADASKQVAQLGANFAVPIEVLPSAVQLVRSQLAELGAVQSPLRAAGGKDGPVITETGGLILDVRFSADVPAEVQLESLPGVLATGVFDRWDYELISVES